VVIVALIYFGVPGLFRADAPVERLIPVTVYRVADETVLPASAPEPAPEPEPLPPTPDVAALPEPAPPPEPTPVPTPAPAAHEPAPAASPPPPPEPITPEPAKPEPPKEVAEAPKPPPPPATRPPEPKHAPPPAPAAPPPPPKPTLVARDEPSPKPKPEPKPKEQVFGSLLKNLAAKAETPEPAKTKPAKPPPVTVTVPPSPSRQVRDAPLSLSIIDAIRRQVEDNWNVPIGARDARDITVEIRIVLQPDGTVTDARILDQARLGRAGQEFFRTVAESAVRAVQKASPLRRLPPEKYEQWREITFTFRPPA